MNSNKPLNTYKVLFVNWANGVDVELDRNIDWFYWRKVNIVMTINIKNGIV